MSATRNWSQLELFEGAGEKRDDVTFHREWLSLATSGRQCEQMFTPLGTVTACRPMELVGAAAKSGHVVSPFFAHRNVVVAGGRRARRPVAATTFIYLLIDPRDAAIRYVGKTNNLRLRYARHLGDGKRCAADHKSRWIASVLRDGLKPIMSVVEECDARVWREREKFHADRAKAAGCDLTNSKECGYGFDPTPEVREKMSAAKRGRPFFAGRTHSDEARKRMSEAAKQRWAAMTPEQRRAATSHSKWPPRPAGWKHTAESKARIRSAAIQSQFWKHRNRSAR